MGEEEVKEIGIIRITSGVKKEKVKRDCNEGQGNEEDDKRT